MIAKLLLAAIALAGGRRWHLAAVHRRGRPGQPAPAKWRDRILPWVFVGPALVLLAVFLVYPAAGTILRSFQDDKGQFTLANFAVMVEPEFTQILRNNVIWLVLGTGASVVLGLIFAGLFDRDPARVAGQDHRLPAAGDLARRRIGHLGLRLRLAARRPAADRTPERGRGRPRRRADPVADDQPDQHLLRDRDPGLAPDRLRHGRLLGSDQGRVGRGPRGGPARWRHRAPALRPGDRAR